MPIDLGLSRIATLLAKLGNPQLKSNFIHVAGTNGKGSVCAYLTSILLSTTKDLKIGKFTSPHLLDRNDSVTLNNIPISFNIFKKVEKDILELNEKFKIGATEFEILTATAFQIFHLEKVDLAVVEVGLGGRLDSTNIIQPAVANDKNEIITKGVVVTGITKIGMDHENILGSTLKEIAGEKAGIIKPKIPNAVDGTNDHDVLEVIRRTADENGCENIIVESATNQVQTRWGPIDRSESPLKGDYQLQNLSLSLKIMELLFPFLSANYPQNVSFSKDTVVKGINNVEWPGRLQSLSLKYSKTESTLNVLLDGAHNGQSAEQLGSYLNQTYGEEIITFIIAVTKGKDLKLLLSPLIRTQDKVILTQFGSVDQMPWIKANDPLDLKQQVQKFTKNVIIETELSKTFSAASDSKNVVVCGSLYLISEVLRLHRKNNES